MGTSEVIRYPEDAPPSAVESGSIVGDKVDGVVTVAEGRDEVELERNFSFLASLGLGFALLNSWTGMSASLQVVLPSGGSVSMVWGLIVAFIGTFLMAVSLAEVCHVFPMSGGQYDWTYMMAPPRYRNGLSYLVGWMACAGWTSLLCAVCSLSATFVIGMIAVWHPTYESKPWQYFLLLIAFLIGQLFVNIFGVRALPMIDRVGGIWAMVGIVTVCVTLLSCSSGHYEPAKNVFAQFTNVTGWPDGMAFLLGLLQSSLGLSGFDAASHMVEEMPNSAINAPRVMMLAVCMGAGSSWIFMVILLFTLRKWDAVVGSTTGPLLEIYMQVLQNKVGVTCLFMFNLFAMAFCVNGIGTVSARMVMSFARDSGFGHVSRFISPVHPTLKVPVYSLIFCAGWVVVFGCVYLGSAVALNAILSGSIVFLQISYLIPICIVFIRGDAAYSNHSQTWSLGKYRRWINGAALAFASLTCVCYLFPPFLPVSGSTMNYAIVAVGVVVIMMTTIWLTGARSSFHGPRDVETRLAVAKST